MTFEYFGKCKPFYPVHLSALDHIQLQFSDKMALSADSKKKMFYLYVTSPKYKYLLQMKSKVCNEFIRCVVDTIQGFLIA
jgi:hypothetical protein